MLLAFTFTFASCNSDNQKKSDPSEPEDIIECAFCTYMDDGVTRDSLKKDEQLVTVYEYRSQTNPKVVYMNRITYYDVHYYETDPEDYDVYTYSREVGTVLYESRIFINLKDQNLRNIRRVYQCPNSYEGAFNCEEAYRCSLENFNLTFSKTKGWSYSSSATVDPSTNTNHYVVFRKNIWKDTETQTSLVYSNLTMFAPLKDIQINDKHLQTMGVGLTSGERYQSEKARFYVYSTNVYIATKTQSDGNIGSFDLDVQYSYDSDCCIGKINLNYLPIDVVGFDYWKTDFLFNEFPYNQFLYYRTNSYYFLLGRNTSHSISFGD